MTIATGDRMPDGSVRVMRDGRPAVVAVGDLFAGKKVVLFSVPGAFTPTCSGKHLPGFIALANDLHAKGVDTIACLSVNDVFVMDAWGRDQGVGSDVLMLADGNGDYTRALGIEQDSTGGGMGMRGRRCAIVVDDGVATHVAIEEPGHFDVSSAESILAVL